MKQVGASRRYLQFVFVKHMILKPKRMSRWIQAGRDVCNICLDYDDTVLLRDRGTIDTIRNLIVALSPSYWHNSDEQWKGLTENPHNVANLIYVAALRKWISAYLVRCASRSKDFWKPAGCKSCGGAQGAHKVRTRLRSRFGMLFVWHALSDIEHIRASCLPLSGKLV